MVMSKHIVSSSIGLRDISNQIRDFGILVLTLDQGGMGGQRPHISTLVMEVDVVATGPPLFLA